MDAFAVDVSGEKYNADSSWHGKPELGSTFERALKVGDELAGI
jgi:hypothetical protein